MPATATLDARSMAGSLVFAMIAFAAGVVDRDVSQPSRQPSTGVLTGTVVGADRYRVLLAGLRPGVGSSTDQIIEGWGRAFRGDELAAGRYRLSVLVDPDGEEPFVVLPLAMPIDAVRLAPDSSDAARLRQFTGAFARASRSADVNQLAPYFDEQFRGPSGQTRAEHLERARASSEAAETIRFDLTLEDAYRAGDRWFAQLGYQGTYRVKRSGDLRTVQGLFSSELRDHGEGLQFLSTEAIPWPTLHGIESLPRRFVAAPEETAVVIRGGVTTTLPEPIVVPRLPRNRTSPPR